MVNSMVMTLDMDGRVVDMNRACEELTKYQLDDVRDRPFWQAMVAPDDAELVKIIFQSSRGSQIPSEFEGEVLARDGSRRRVSWSLKVLSTGQVQTILVTGRDQTAQAEIKAELQRVKSLAEETTATLSQLTAKLDTRPAATARAARAAGDRTRNSKLRWLAWRRRRRPRPRRPISAAVRGGPIAIGRASPP